MSSNSLISYDNFYLFNIKDSMHVAQRLFPSQNTPKNCKTVEAHTTSLHTSFKELFSTDLYLLKTKTLTQNICQQILHLYKCILHMVSRKKKIKYLTDPV